MSALEADRIRLADIKAQILDLERSPSALQLEQTLVQARLDSYTYPVLTLPNEIVCEIFLRVLPTYPACPPLTGPLSPIYLAQICGQWRAVAVATPKLWSAIQLSDQYIPFHRQYHTFTIWLGRSRSRPLSICIDEYRTALGPEFFSVLTPHRTRWEHLKLDLLKSYLPIHELDGPMPLLRSLDLELLYIPDAFTFHDVPLLRAVVLDYSTAVNIILPWMQLTSVTLRYVSPSQCAPVLQQTGNLVHCKLHLGSNRDDDDLPAIALPYLESLTLILMNPRAQAETKFLATFIVPALRHLDIWEGFLLPNAIASLTSFISKPGCKLRQVHIEGPRSVPEDSYRQAFPLIPKISFGTTS
ncbi:hypothetical protein B0H19DRAFT_144141 [Mycena capillaripes]|nr:hypothetical protein B0H19DRAFT_144141 [Mycena capillaripes]